jgi:FkbM family methyltransferase
MLMSAVRWLLRHRVRGSNRLLFAFAERVSRLRAYPVAVPGGELPIDLRRASSHGLFAANDGFTGEHLVLRRCVRPGDVVIDIGANIGYFTIWLSHLAGPGGRVYAFEPNPAHAEMLRKLAAERGNVTFLPIALSDEKRDVEFFVPEDDSMASLADWTNSQSGAVRKVICHGDTLDGLLERGIISRPDVIKCDIEGGELQCFRGGMAMLDRRDAPIVLFEANANNAKGFGLDVSAALDHLASLPAPRFTFFMVSEDGELSPITEAKIRHGNILAVPAARTLQA